MIYFENCPHFNFWCFFFFFITKGHFIHNKCNLLHNLTYMCVCPFMHEDNTVHKWQGKSLKLNRSIISSSLHAQQNIDLSANVIPVIQFKHRRETMSIYHNWDPPTQEKLTRESCTITFQQLQQTLKKCGCQSMICVWYVIFSQNIHTVHSKLYALNVRKMWADALHS